MIVLHIGISKTGSSAIQRDLVRCRRQLSDAGVHYGGCDQGSAARAISSGNGVPLARWLNPALRRHPGDEQIDLSPYVSASHPISLISCEALSSALPERLALLRDEVLAGEEVRIVAFVRDIYPHAVSSWMQNIKRTAYTGDLMRFCARKYGSKQRLALENFSEVFGAGKVTALHYDSLRTDIFAALLAGMGVAWAPAEPTSRVNRGLTEAEIEVLQRCNAVHKSSGLATMISDHLLERRPGLSPARIRSDAAVSLLQDRFGDDVAWINERCFAGAPVLAVGGVLPGGADAPEDVQDIWPMVIEALALNAQAQTEEARRRHAAHKAERQAWAAEKVQMLAQRRLGWLSRTQAAARRLLPA